VDIDATPGGSGGSWDDAYTDLQSALAAAESGSEIWVAEGTYTPTSAGGLRSLSFNLKTGVDVYGGFEGTESTLEERVWTSHVTVLSGDLNGDDTNGGDNSDNSYHVVFASGVTDATLDGFTITAGNANGASGVNFFGGGMYNSSSSPKLTNVTFIGNSADSDGGGMCNEYNSSPTLINVTFRENLAYYGGGMANYSSSSPMLTDVTFSGNSADYGGGMYNYSSSSPTLTNVTFSGNSAGWSGGGIYNYSSSPTLTNVAFSGNSAGWSGGGIYNSSSSPTLANVTFSGNLAVHYGGGIYNYSSSPTLTNSILWGDTAQTGAEIHDGTGSTSSVTYSIVQGGWAGASNKNADPLFMRPPSPGSDEVWGTADDDYGDLRLQAGSPAIDAGNNEAVLPDVADLDGDGDTGEATPLDLNMLPRFVGTPPIVDMGAYESQNENPNNPPVADDQSLTANEDTPKPISLTATDPDDDELTFHIVSPPSHGTLTDFDPEKGTVVYTPNPDYHGDDSFTFKADDGSEDSNEATVNITVLSAEDQIGTIIDEVFHWVDEGFLNWGTGQGLVSNLDTAIAKLEDGKATPAVNTLEAFENQIHALVKSGRLSDEDAEALIALADTAIHSIQAGSEDATAAAFADLGGDAVDVPLDSPLVADFVSLGSQKPGNGRK